MTKNMLFFDIYTCKIFDKLLNAFPLNCDINTKDLQLRGDDSEICSQTIIYLKKLGFIDFSGEMIGDCLFEECYLTAKGLSILRTMPKSLQEKKSIAEAISDLAKDFKGEAVKNIVNLIFKTL